MLNIDSINGFTVGGLGIYASGLQQYALYDLKKLPSMNHLRLQSKKLAILVLGVQRSGTSALTKTLSMGGLELPKTLIEPDPLNPLGFWESDVLLTIHRHLLNACGSNLTDILPLPKGWLELASVQALEADLERAFISEFGDTNHCIVKDPRICRLFPIWRRLLDRLGWDYRVVIPVRHPAEVIGSMEHQGKAVGLRAQLVWLLGFLAAEAASRGVRRGFITFDQLLEDPITHAERLSNELDLNLQYDEQARAEVKEYLTFKPRNRAKEEARDRQVTPICRAAFQWAQAQAGGAPSSVRIERLQSLHRTGVTVCKPLLRTRKWILRHTRDRNPSAEESA